MKNFMKIALIHLSLVTAVLTHAERPKPYTPNILKKYSKDEYRKYVFQAPPSEQITALSKFHNVCFNGKPRGDIVFDKICDEYKRQLSSISMPDNVAALSEEAAVILTGALALSKCATHAPSPKLCQDLLNLAVDHTVRSVELHNRQEYQYANWRMDTIEKGLLLEEFFDNRRNCIYSDQTLAPSVASCDELDYEGEYDKLDSSPELKETLVRIYESRTGQRFAQHRYFIPSDIPKLDIEQILKESRLPMLPSGEYLERFNLREN